MKFRVRKPAASWEALKRWHIWFAWYPVRVPTRGRLSGQTLVWLEKVKRKGTYTPWGMSWEYLWKKDKTDS